MRTTSTTVPGWLVFIGMTVVALTVMGGVVALLIMGRDVPGELWGLVGAIGVAYFGAGPFMSTLSKQAVHEAQLLDTTNHSIESMRLVSLAHAAPVTGLPARIAEGTT